MTNYSLEVRNVKDLNEYKNLSESIEEFDLYRYVFDTGAYYKKYKEAVFKCWEAQKWEHYEGQMIILSEKYPQMTFELTCQQNERFWRIYFKDGATELCIGEVTFETPRKIAWDDLDCFGTET